MVDGDDERDDDLRDRLLVRPYVLPDEPDAPAEPAVAAPGRDLVLRTIEGDPPTDVFPTTGRAPAPPVEVTDRPMVLWLVGAGLAVVVAAAIVVVALWPRNDTGPQQASSGAPVMPVGAGREPALDRASAAGNASPSLSPSGSASPSRPTESALSRQPGAPASGIATAARTGPVANGEGQCLDAGTVGVPSAGILARDCSGSASQRWSFFADRTLRVGGLCAGADTEAIRTTACTGGTAQQWASGSGGTVVNVGTGQCLTDPRNGAKGGRVRLEPCQGDGQDWSLP